MVIVFFGWEPVGYDRRGHMPEGLRTSGPRGPHGGGQELRKLEAKSQKSP